MSVLGSLFSTGVNPNANSTGVTSNLNSGGTQRSFFLQPDVKASSLSTTLSGNIKGSSKSTDSNGNKYSPGFTPDVDYYVDKSNIDKTSGFPVERGVVYNSSVSSTGIPRDTNDILDQDVPNAFDAFDDESNYEYLHHLDRGEIPIGLKLTKDSDIYLSSFVETDTDNEDPISFGYDLIIDYDTSPLFNGAVEDFINNFSSYAEISSRLDILSSFKQQFFKFFKIDSQNLLGLDEPRTYYLQKISGLNELSESISSDKSKQFVDYGKDYITLTLREDVSVNTGYLAALYKLLTWSRVHGKKMIPDNLLRFDIEIVITEARRFNRVVKNSDSTLNQYADLISRYKYKLYECQFFFERLSHENDIDMTNLDYTNSFELKFNYKYTNLRFEKFTDSASIMVGSDIIRDHVAIDNSAIDLSKVDPKNSNSFTINNNSIVVNPIDYVLNKYSPTNQTSTYYPIGSNQTTQTLSPLQILNQNNVAPDPYQAKLANINTNTLINTKTNQSSLLQKTLQNISSTFQADLKRAIYTLKQDITDFFPKNILGGFTEDGYEYNIPAYYINKAFNTVNSSIKNTLGTIRQDIYEQKNIFVQSNLMVINNAIDSGNNLLNNEVGKLSGQNGSNPKEKPSNIYTTENVTPINTGTSLNIYGNSTVQPLIYSGSDVSSDNFPDTPSHHTGRPLNIYSYNPTFPDTPTHDTGAPLDIYSFQENVGDLPPHHTGTPLNIYDYNPTINDMPPHHTGTPLDIYSFDPNNPDTPPHHTGKPINIYDTKKAP